MKKVVLGHIYNAMQRDSDEKKSYYSPAYGDVLLLRKDDINQTEQLIEIPVINILYMRYTFFDHKGVSLNTLHMYQLPLKNPICTPYTSIGTCVECAEWLEQAHCLCEDYNIEIEFDEFLFHETVKLCEQWCIERQIEYDKQSIENWY